MDLFDSRRLLTAGEQGANRHSAQFPFRQETYAGASCSQFRKIVIGVGRDQNDGRTQWTRTFAQDAYQVKSISFPK